MNEPERETETVFYLNLSLGLIVFYSIGLLLNETQMPTVKAIV